MTTAAIILAAGKGTRFKSATPKVLHRVAGRTMLAHVLEAVRPLGFQQVIVVVGHGADQVTAEAEGAGVDGLSVVLQAEQNGTGHAVQTALPALADGVDRVIVLPGDTPLLQASTLEGLLGSSGGALLVADVDDPSGYGRVIAAGTDAAAIVEHDDADPDQRRITAVNAGMYAFDRALLARHLDGLGTDNAQGELYLTDVVAAAHGAGTPMAIVEVDAAEVSGVNDRVQLADAGSVLRRRHLDRLMRSGVTVLDPEATWVDTTVTVGPDSVLLPGCLLEGATSIGANARIGPDCHLVDTEVADGALVRNAVTDGARIGPDATVGPFTYLRPGTVLGRGAKAGGFVEMKNATVGDGSKVPHLSYIGDATIGVDANIGAGTITCNYDGFDKHQTVVGDRAFIGSDTMLVAPVVIGEGAVTGAGSVVFRDVPADALAVERSEQANLEGWAARRRQARGSA